MLKKIDEMPVDAGDPLSADQLGRKADVNNLAELIRHLREPYVIAVNGPWGSGKTTFARMLQPYLEKQGHPGLIYNAWEDDYADDPLVALIAEIETRLKPEDKKKKLWKDAKAAGAAIAKRSIPLLVRLGTQGLLELDDTKKVVKAIGSSASQIGDFAEQQTKDAMKAYRARKSAAARFRTTLGAFLKELPTERRKLPFVLFIDELDRCRPTFAVEMLERLKHVFDVPGLVFVLCVDTAQLAHSIRALYGHDMDAEGYLRRFIEFQYDLPRPPYIAYCEHLYRSLAFESALKEHKEVASVRNLFAKALAAAGEVFGFSLRTLERCATHAFAVFATWNTELLMFPRFSIFLIALRLADHQLYSAFCHGEASAEAIIGSIQQRSDAGAAFFRTPMGGEIGGYLLLATRVKLESGKGPNQIGITAPEAQTAAERIVNGVKEMLSRQGVEQESFLPYLVRRIEMAERFGPIT